MKRAERVALAVEYAKAWLLKPYLWGGDDFTGMDCSGLCQEILASVGLDPKGDQTAQAYHNYFSKHGDYNRLGPGALLFYGKKYDRIRHVAFALNREYMIEAGGGDSSTKTEEDAARTNAFVRIRPIHHRSDFFCSMMPEY